MQKCEFTEKREFCVIGDLHGSVHALLRILLNLGVEEKLYDFKIIKDNFYIVFLGDYVDRGNYGAEVLYTLCLLKMANWDRVFLLRGNHEYLSAWNDYGFLQTVLGVLEDKITGKKRILRESGELKTKFESYGNKNTVAEIVAAAIKLVRCFPLALFIKSKATYNGFWDWLTGPGDSVVLCTHGGFVANYSPRKLLNAPKEIYEHIPALGHKQDGDSESSSVLLQKDWAGSFNWSDFDYKDGDLNFNRARGLGLIFHKDMTLKYLRSNKINAVLRGHEHCDFGLKMLGKAGGEDSKGLVLETRKQAHWTDIVPESQRVNNEILVYKYYPVFTFSAASGAPSCFQPYDCYGILTTAKKWQDWSLKVSEVVATNSREVKSRGRV
ncbi:MAG: metallophosphoesterase family protein [bacterium]